MNEMKIFNSEEFGQIRMTMVDGKPYFMASDVAKALGYVRPNDAIKQHCRATVKYGIPISGKIQEVNFISEGDMYRLITHSKLESAERFESWVFDEVLPSLRISGTYTMNNCNTTIPRVKGSQTPIPKNGNWYDKVNPKIKLICEVYSIERKKLYHVILTNIQGVYNWDYAVKAYINETGSAPRFPMEVVAHFQQFQEAAEQVMDILLERAGYGE